MQTRSVHDHIVKMVRILWPAGGLVLGLASTFATLSTVSGENSLLLADTIIQANHFLTSQLKPSLTMSPTFTGAMKLQAPTRLKS